jgi:hypothetical protein
MNNLPRVYRAARPPLILWVLQSILIFGQRARADNLTSEAVRPIAATALQFGCFNVLHRPWVLGNGGSGFFVDGDGDFITSSDAIADVLAYANVPANDCTPVAIVSQPMSNHSLLAVASYVPFAVVGCVKNDYLKIGLCKTASPAKDKAAELGAPVQFDATPLALDTELVSCGFPLASNSAVIATGDVVGFTTDGGGDLLVVSVPSWAASEGAPVFLAGNLVGVVLSSSGQGIEMVRPAAAIETYLKQRNINFSDEANKKQQYGPRSK